MRWSNSTVTKLNRLAASWPILLISIAAILSWRCYSYLVAPELRAEDGRHIFAYFYEHRRLAALIRFKSGYIPFLPNLLGFLAVRLPARATPYFLTIVPTFLTLAVLSVQRASAYRLFLASDAHRFCLCLGLALAHIGNHFTVCHTDYSIWNALLLLMLLSLLPMPRSWPRALPFGMILVVLCWSHPLSILALPPTLLWLWRDRGVLQRGGHALVAISQLTHVWFGTEPHRAAIAKGSEPLWSQLTALAGGVLNHLCRGVLRPTIFPWGPATAEFDYALAAVFIGMVLACALLPKEPLATRAFYAWVGYGWACPMTLIAFARAERGLQSVRYHYVSKAFAAIALCLVLLQILTFLVQRWSTRFTAFGALPVLGTLLYFVAMNESVGGLSGYRLSDPENSRRIATFFSQLAEAERIQGGHCNIRLTCHKGRGDWSFAIDTRRHCD